jgi:hypothetical protein
MKILCLSLGRNGTQSFNDFMGQQGFSTTHFYEFQKIATGTFAENADGIEEHFNSLPATDVHVDIPTCLIFDRLYERFPDAKFINITRPENEWLGSMRRMLKRLDYIESPFIFEEAYCNIYAQTGKRIIKDLTDEELLFIRNKHLEKIDSLFKYKENYLEVELSDPEIGKKIGLFVGGNPDLPFPSTDAFRKDKE